MTEQQLRDMFRFLLDRNWFPRQIRDYLTNDVLKERIDDEYDIRSRIYNSNEESPCNRMTLNPPQFNRFSHRREQSTHDLKPPPSMKSFLLSID